jgi:hypothetical protein
MSVLERVIEDQQKTIDQLRADVDALERSKRVKAEEMNKYYEERDEFFKNLNRLVNRSAYNAIKPDSPDWNEWVHEIRMYMIDNHWCMNCESTSCFGDCYD